jgi:RNA polymerase-binding transcription factor DksA
VNPIPETASDRAGALRAQLVERLDELRDRLAARMATAAEATFEALGGEVRDSGDDAAVIEHTGVHIALIERCAGEIDEIEAALGRLAEGRYGECADCGLDIERERLRALPTARRCGQCQRVFESRSGR